MKTENSYLEMFFFFPELFLIAFGLIFLLVGVFLKRKPYETITVAITTALVFTLYFVNIVPTGDNKYFLGQLVADDYSQFFKNIILVAGVFAITLGYKYFKELKIQKFEYNLLALFSIIGMMFMVSANDLISLYIGLELMSLPLYVLAAFNTTSVKSSEAGVKYFILGAVASAMFLFGTSIIYGFIGVTEFDAISKALGKTSGVYSIVNANQAVLLGMVFIIVAFCFKVSAAPFHMWAPDVYEGAPTPVTAFFSAVPKIAAIAIFIKILYAPFENLYDYWMQVIIVASVLSMIIGSFGAIMQTNIKRMLAYSSIGHVGFMLMGIASGNADGIKSVIIYLSIYVFMSLGAFACVLLAKNGSKYYENISDFAGISKTNPKLAFALAAFMLSLAGIPPMAGFFGKVYVISAAINSGLIYLAIFGVMYSVVASFYYLRMIKIMYFDAPDKEIEHSKNYSLIYALIICLGLQFLFFLYGPYLISASDAAASAL